MPASLARWLRGGLLALVVVASLAGCAPDARVGTQKGEVAPDFSLPALEGGEKSLRDYRGRVVLLNFWATWCGPCRAEMPDMQAVYEELSGRGFVVVAVNGGEGRDRVQSFVEEFGLTFPVLVDEERGVLRQYGVRGFPTTFVIDGDGVIQQVIVGGPLPGSAVRRLVEPLLE
ncbi:MAG: TlpA family protein disulfide reductase [Anaerolineae bacterium]|nr:TlpA family protein disulfide reductase [Anaerolineae bacterium]